jgi:DNA-binding transcriptional MerR regulator
MPAIPGEKRYFRIGEVSRIIGVETYVLRYWESEFPQIRPSRADSNQRTYQRKDLEVLSKIKRLLYEEKLTIEGARRRLKQEKKQKNMTPQECLQEVKSELKDILKTLST